MVKADDFRVKGEKEVLYGSLADLAVVLIFLVGVSFGVVLLLIGIGVVVVKVKQGQFLGQCVRVGDNRFPEIHELVKTSAERLSMRPPEVYLTPGSSGSHRVQFTFEFPPWAMTLSDTKKDCLGMVEEFTRIAATAPPPRPRPRPEPTSVRSVDKAILPTPSFAGDAGGRFLFGRAGVSTTITIKITMESGRCIFAANRLLRTSHARSLCPANIGSRDM